MIELQQALYQRLTGDAALVASLSQAWPEGVAVFSRVPQHDADDDSLFPYITLPTENRTPWDTKTDLGTNSVFQISVWTRGEDDVPTKQIAGAVYDLLHTQPLTISGASHVMTRNVSTGFLPDPDGKTLQGVMLFRVIYQNS